jgi:DNA-directed RNA polymerase specialized sigma24 family protein
VEGFEIKEIAFVTSSTENAVMANLSRTRQKIREYLAVFND